MNIALISCVKSKRQNVVCRAMDLYTSDLFEKSLRYCLRSYDKVFILSAKYGLLNLDDLVTYYEKTLNKMTKKEREHWSLEVLNRLKIRSDIEKDVFYFHCGERYRDGIIPHIKNYQIPLCGMGLGEQLQFYKKWIG